MAAITLRTLWIHDAVNPADHLRFPLMVALRRTPVTVGDVRLMAGGRRRAVTRRGQTTTVEATLPHCTRTEIEWLVAHLNVPVMARDDRGTKVYGVYFDLPVDAHRYNRDDDTSISITEISWDESA